MTSPSPVGPDRSRAPALDATTVDHDDAVVEVDIAHAAFDLAMEILGQAQADLVTCT